MKRLLLIIFLLCFFSVLPAFAVKVTSLYQAELPVSSQAEDVKAKAVKAGLLQVLVKISGDPDITKNPLIHAALNKADYYIQEYSYSSTTTDSSHFLIQIHYNPADINRLLKKAGVAYWGENRPLILVWLAVASPQQGTIIIGNEAPGTIYASMKLQGKKYGLPLIFPMMDVADVSQVSPADITQMAVPVLQEAGKRYEADALLIGKFGKQDNLYQGQWQLVMGNNTWNFTGSGATLDAAIDTVMSNVSQTLAKYYRVKITNAPEAWVKLEVSNVTRRNDLNGLVQYLKQLTSVQQVRLSMVTGDVVELAVLIRGPLLAFQQNATIGQHLVLKEQNEADNKLSYEWTH